MINTLLTGRIRKRWKFVAGAMLLSLWAACSTFVPRHGWSPQLGPVVPHDTFPANCSLCHVSRDWHTLRDDFEFDHAAQTGVPLIGAHADAACVRCHNDRGPVKRFAARGCAGCHEDVHRAKHGPNCTDCHNQNTWQPRQMVIHHNRTRFPLVGAHVATACIECHSGANTGNFTGQNPACATCHLPEYQRTTHPDHAAAGFSTQCQTCHNPVGWTGGAITAHPASFPLSAGHAGRSCTDCHAPGAFAGLSTECASCHLADFQQTTSPNHAASGFSTDCKSCHGTTAWQGASFTHPASFPLTAGHTAQSCNACHTGGTYTGLSTTCASCHLVKYQQTTNPNHTAAGFSTDCKSCHNTTAWLGAPFTHVASFPLTAGHSGQSCTACHTGGTYLGLSAACSSCHLPDFQQTTNPNHTAAGFPTDCRACHNTTTWAGAVFNHTFPINNGPHRTLSCTDCHLNAQNYSQFSCTHCHEHTQNRMDSDHREVNGYVWSSPSCLSCHPQGRS